MIDFAIDTETELITDTCKAPRLVCVSAAWPDGSAVSRQLLHHEEAEAHLAWWIGDMGCRLIGQNIAYDFGVVGQAHPHLMPAIWRAYEADRVQDTSLRERLIDIAQGRYQLARKGFRPYSLETLAKKYLGWQLDKDTWRLRYGELRDLPVSEWPEEAREYSLKDAESTLLVKQAQDRYSPFFADEFRQARAAWWIHLMSAWGIRTDLDQVLRLEEDSHREYAELEQILMEHGLVRDDKKRTRNTKLAKARMVEVMRRDPKNVEVVDGVEKVLVKATQKQEISLDREACEDSGDPVLKAYAGLSALKTVIAKDIPFLKRGEIHSRFEPILATGRTSSSDPNIQNPRREGGVRECFVPRPGHVFACADYAIIELRTWAQVCIRALGESRLAERINAGFDPHLDLGAQVLGISYEEALANKKRPDVADARQKAKPGNFGFPGGMGANKFRAYAKASYGMLFTLEEAINLRARWMKNWPEAQKYFDWIQKRHEWRLFHRKEYSDNATTIRQHVSDRYRGGCSYTEACNGYFQALAADIGKAAGFEIARACYDETVGSILFGSRIVNFVHDEFILEVPDDALAHERAVEVGRIAVEQANRFIPDVPAKCEPLLCRRWSKSAEPVYEAGRLVPWGVPS